MARALIVGCGCRGRMLGGVLLDSGWQVRGTSRTDEGVARIEAAGIEGVLADPDRVGTVVDQLDGVAVLIYLMASAEAEPEAIAAVHGPRLERLLEKLVDSPVRGFVYEAAGTVAPSCLEDGRNAVREASRRWRIPRDFIETDPADRERWLGDALSSVTGLLS